MHDPEVEASDVYDLAESIYKRQIKSKASQRSLYGARPDLLLVKDCVKHRLFNVHLHGATGGINDGIASAVLKLCVFLLQIVLSGGGLRVAHRTAARARV